MAQHTIKFPPGQHGYTIWKAGSTYSGTYYCVVALGRATFTTMVDAANPGQSWADISLADGTQLWGRFTDVTVSTGVAIAYKTI